MYRAPKGIPNLLMRQNRWVHAPKKLAASSNNQKAK